MQNEDILKALWKSTEELHRRFYGDKVITLDARHRVFMEEVGEFLLEVAKCHILDNSYGDCAKECADVIVTAMGLLMGLDIPYGDLKFAIELTMQKNDAKTLETHHVRPDGKIARRDLSTEQQEAK